MADFTYPSREFPAMPSVRLRAPDGWTAVPSPGAALAARAADEPGAFTANVLVTLTRQLADASLETALAAVREELEQFSESRVEEPFLANFGEDRYVVVNTAVAHPEFGMMVQVHAYTSFLYGQLKDVVHVVGTCAGARLAQDYPILQQVMESTRIRVDAEAAPQPA